MKSSITLILLFFCCNKLIAQYQFDSSFSLSKINFNTDFDMSEYAHVKGFGHNYFALFQYPANDSLVIYNFDINKGCFVDTLQLQHVPDMFVRDICITANHIILIGTGRFININRKSLKFYYHERNTTDVFSAATVMDGGYICLFSDYFYGVNRPSIILNVFDPATNRIIKNAEFNTVGVLPQMLHRWVVSCGDKLLVFSPFSPIYKIINRELKCVATKNLSQSFGIDSMSNNFGKRFDQFIQNEKLRIERQPEESTVFNTKDFCTMISDSIRKNYSYIEKVLTYNDTEVVISMYRPGANFDYRSVYVFAPFQNKIKKIFPKWRSTTAEFILKKEDALTIDLSNDANKAAYFYNNEIYDFGLSPDSLVSLKMSKDDYLERKFQFVFKNGYQWHIQKFQF